MAISDTLSTQGAKRSARGAMGPAGQGCNFWKLFGGAERRKDAQGTIKILLDTDFT